LSGQSGSSSTVTPGIETAAGRASKKARRWAVGPLLVLFQLDTRGNVETVPASIIKSRSSEKRSMMPKPLERLVPPLNQMASPAWCMAQRLCVIQ
jgi:hypothetical protein